VNPSTLRSDKLIVSVGYEGRDVSELLSCLADHGVSVLVDVRLNAISRKPGLSKRALGAAAAEAGIEYVHLRALGNPRDNREDFRSGSTAGRRRFLAELGTADGRIALKEVVDLVSARVIALLCFEADHNSCHRSCVADEVGAQLPQLEIIQA